MDGFHHAFDLLGNQVGVHRERELLSGPRFRPWQLSIDDRTAAPRGVCVHRRVVVDPSLDSVCVQGEGDSVTVAEAHREEVIDTGALRPFLDNPRRLRQQLAVALGVRAPRLVPAVEVRQLDP